MSRIIRVFRARAKPGLVEALEQRLRDEVLPELAVTPGLLVHHAGVPHGDSRDFLMVTIWEDLDAVRAFAGEDYTQAVLYGDTRELIEDMSLEHYEGVE
jgi:quinol monooxygenase YgiN